MVLAEGIAPDQSTTSQKLLTDLGVNVPAVGNNKVPRKAPHEKYYWSQSIISYRNQIKKIFIIVYLLTTEKINQFHIKFTFISLLHLFGSYNFLSLIKLICKQKFTKS